MSKEPKLPIIDAPAWSSGKVDPKQDERLKQLKDDIETGKVRK